MYLPAWHFYLIHCEPAPQLLLPSDLRCLKLRMERGCDATWQSEVVVKGVPLLSRAPLEGFSSQLHSVLGDPLRWPDHHRPFFPGNGQQFCHRQCVGTGMEKLHYATDWGFCLCFFLTVNLNIWSKVKTLFWVAWTKAHRLRDCEDTTKSLVSSASIEELTPTFYKAKFRNVACHMKFRRYGKDYRGQLPILSKL